MCVHDFCSSIKKDTIRGTMKNLTLEELGREFEEIKKKQEKLKEKRKKQINEQEEMEQMLSEICDNLQQFFKEGSK